MKENEKVVAKSYTKSEVVNALAEINACNNESKRKANAFALVGTLSAGRKDFTSKDLQEIYNKMNVLCHNWLSALEHFPEIIKDWDKDKERNRAKAYLASLSDEERKAFLGE